MTAPIAASPRHCSIAWRLFLTCWIVYVLHFATNTVRELYPALSLADHFSFDVSEYADFHPDIFKLPGRGAFINNNPGASVVGVVPYMLCKPGVDYVVARVQRQRAAQPASQAAQYDSPWPLVREFMRKARERGLDIKFGLAAGIMQALAMAPLSALAVVVMFRLLAVRTGSPRAALWLALLYAFATPVFYRTAQLNQNLLVCHAALFAFYLLWKQVPSAQCPVPSVQSGSAHGSRLTAHGFFPAGLLCGFAVLCDYSALVVVLALGLYALAQSRAATDIVRFALGVAVCGAGLMAYQWSCFGSPFFPPQHYMPAAHFTERGYQGFDWPQLDLLFDTTFGLRFGLFTSAPLLALALWVPGWTGPILGRREKILATGFTLAFLVFCSANQYGRMQFNCGVRHVVPVTPFVFLLAATVLLRLPRLVAAAIGVAAAYCSWCLTMYRDVELGTGIPESLRFVTLHGPRLPWIETMWRMGLPGTQSATPAVATTIVLLLAGVVIAGVWWGFGKSRTPAAD